MSLLPIDAEKVWGAAAGAFRINSGYVKVVKWPPSPEDPVDDRPANKTLVRELLATPESITDEDMERGAQIRAYYKTLLFKVIRGATLSDYDKHALRIADLDEISNQYDFAVLVSLISSYDPKVKRDAVENRVRFATGGMIGKIGDKVTLTIEVLRVMFSQQWNTNYVTGITTEDQAVFFSFKSNPVVGSTMTISGIVKAHRESTQLSRVKVKA